MLDEIRWAGIYWVQCSGRGKVLGFPGFVGWDLLDWLDRFGVLDIVYLLGFDWKGLLDQVCWVRFAALGFLGQVY